MIWACHTALHTPLNDPLALTSLGEAERFVIPPTNITNNLRIVQQ